MSQEGKQSLRITNLTAEEVVALVREGLRQELSSLRALDEEAVALERLARKEYLTDVEVEKLYGLNAHTLRKYRSIGLGPAFSKDGEKVLYRRQAVAAYLESKEQKTYAP